MTTTKWIILVILIIIATIIIRDLIRMKRLIKVSDAVITSSPKFDRTIPNASARIVIIGDSTAAGTGTMNPEESIAGRFGQLYPSASIENYGIVGQKIHELLTNSEIQKLNQSDILIIQIGGNDLLQFTKLDEVKKDLYLLLEKAKDSGAGKVAILHTAKLGTAPFFPPYLAWIMVSRAEKMREMYIEATQKYNISYVDLIGDDVDAKFAVDPDKFYSPDMLHPSGAGYEIWFDSIVKSLSR